MKNALPEEFTVVIKATGNVTTDEDGVSVDVKPGKFIGSNKQAFKVDKNFFKYYTGEEIKLDADDFVAGKISNPDNLVLGTDFVIASYKNNVKKGTMTVTIQGIGEYSGTKSIKVKIKAKPFDKSVTEN